jgi:outer membrane protein assembly factor BamB
MAFEARSVVIGTHGKSYAGTNEASDGVYVLEGATGKLRRFIPTPGRGDKDVGGVALEGASGVVFTTDNGQVVSARLEDGAVLWKRSLSGKVRPAPALAQLNGAGAFDVVVGDENGDLYALDGDSGAVLWTMPTGTNDYDARGFVAAVALADVDADGVDDVIAGARDGVLVAYAGRDGRELWREQGGSGIHASPSIGDFDGDRRLDVLAAWSYSRVAILDARTGSVRYEQHLEQDRGGIEGLFASPLPLPRATGPALLVQGTSWWGGARGKRQQDTIDGVVLAGQNEREFRSDEGRVSASAVIMDLGDDGVWDAVLGTEAGELLALGADGTRRPLGKLGGSIEATALVADVDGDERYELLVAAGDGWLSCFRTSSRTPPLVARFRGNVSDNRGLLSGVELRWGLAAR